jgi:hypothetical protein
MRQFRSFAAACVLALATAVATLGGVPAQAQQAGATRFEGVLTIIWGDPRPGAQGGGTRFTLTTADGVEHRLDVGPGQRSAAVSAFGQRVAIVGRQSRNAAGASRIVVDRVEALQSFAAPERRALTTRRVLYILLKFNGDAQEPHPTTFYRDLTNPRTPPVGFTSPATINGFFFRTSYGRLQWQADVAGQGGLNPTQWFTLPKTKAQYANCGWDGVCADLNGIKDDGLALAAAAGVNLAVYDNINFVLNNDLDCCAWGGSIFYNGKLYGSTWEPPWGQEAATYVHELGHSIGLPHSGWRYHAYDSPWDEMSRGSSAQSVQCGTYNSANSGGAASGIFCNEPGGGYITAHKEVLGWLPPANRALLAAVGTKSVTLSANAMNLGTTVKMLKICLKGFACQGNNARFLTIESRIRGVQFDDGLPGDGVIIHDFRRNRPPIGVGDPCFFNSQSGWAVPIDTTPGDWQPAPVCSSTGALSNAQLTPGRTYRNNTLGVIIQVVRKQGTAYVVRATRTK